MLRNTSTEDDHAGLPRLALQRLVIHAPYVLHDVDHQPVALVRVEVEHIPKRPISESRTIDWNPVLRCPIAYGPLVVNLPAQPLDHFGRGPLCARILFPQHFLQNRHDPVLELAVVVVRY